MAWGYPTRKDLFYTSDREITLKKRIIAKENWLKTNAKKEVIKRND